MIEIGDYFRTKTGFIIKADFIDFESLTIGQKRLCYEFEDIERMEEFIKTEIVKHSKNIIDLIEVGDMLKINDEKYEVIFDKSYGKLGVLIPSKKELAIRHSAIEFIFQNNNAVSIVTKEQFESVSFKV